MATIASTHGVSPPAAGDLTPQQAMRYAWVSWASMLVFPFAVFMVVVWKITNSDLPSTSTNMWFIISMGYLVLAVPASIFWRSKVFRPYWDGHVVQPRAYLRGMLAVWIAIEIGGLLALFGCYMTNSMMPCMIPGAIAFMFFTPLYPNGTAMTRNTGNVDDPARYVEPR